MNKTGKENIDPEEKSLTVWTWIRNSWREPSVRSAWFIGILLGFLASVWFILEIADSVAQTLISK